MRPGQIRELLEAAFGELGHRRYEATLSLCDRILVRHPGQADALHLAGIARIRQGNQGDAADLLERAADARPDDPEILGNLGVAYLATGRGADAAGILARAAALNPDDPLIHANLGAAERASDRLAEAEASLDRALAIDPDHVPALFNKGNTLCGLGRLEEAGAYYRRAIELSPTHAAARIGLGFVCEGLGDNQAAREAVEACLAVDPDHQDARCRLALLQLAAGQFADGWRNYLSRPSMREKKGVFREILPCDLAGKSVLAVRDQGLGDEIFFFRFLPALRGRGAKVSCLSSERLAAMLARTGLAEIVTEKAAGARDFNFRISLGDLPYMLGGHEGAETPPDVELVPIPARENRLKRRLQSFGPAPYIGVTWRAGARGRRLLYKEYPADLAASLLRPLDARVVILQRAPGEGEVAAFAAALGRDVLDFSEMNADLEDMLALVGLLDEHICVSNTNVHLAAARGRACRVLVPSPPEFRWMAAGRESPWFPGMKIYRQGPDGDWSRAFETLGRDLVDRI